MDTPGRYTFDHSRAVLTDEVLHVILNFEFFQTTWTLQSRFIIKSTHGIC